MPSKTHYKCPVCGEAIYNRNAGIHFKAVHPIYGYEFIQTSSTGTRKRGHYLCAVCNEIIAQGDGSILAAVVRHYTRHHSEMIHPCDKTHSTSATANIKSPTPVLARSNQAVLSKALDENDFIMFFNKIVERMNKAESGLKPLQDEISRLKTELETMHKGYESQSREISSLTSMNNVLRSERDDYKKENEKCSTLARLNLPAMQEFQNIRNAQ